MINMEAIPKFDIKSDIKFDNRFDIRLWNSFHVKPFHKGLLVGSDSRKNLSMVLLVSRDKCHVTSVM